jgi:tetratricopeptide (TPR) repeat protein
MAKPSKPIVKKEVKSVSPVPKKIVKKKPFFNGLQSPSLLLKAIVIRFKAGFRYLITSPVAQLKGFSLDSFTNSNSAIYRLAFVTMIVFSILIMPVLSFDYGLTWDEKIQRDYGKEIIEYYASGKKDTSLFDQTKHLYNTMLYYGCSFDVLTGIVHDKLAPTSDEFELRHIINSLFGIFMMIYTALIARFLGNWRAACLAFIFCMLSPSLFGHSMNNPKDIPFAASYIFTIYFMLRFLKQLPQAHIKNLFFMAIGIGWTVSTRAGGIILIAFLGLFIGLLWLYQIKKSGISSAFGQIKRYAVYFSITSIAGYFIGLIIWPYGQRAPLTNPMKALKSLSNVNYLHTYENFDGLRIYMSNVPWYYTIKWISIGTPLFILIGLAIAIGGFAQMKKKINYWFIGLLTFIFVFPIFYIVYKNSMVYNGWRHFLFVYLSLVIIAALSWEYLLSNSNIKWVKIGAGVVLLGLLAKVGFWMVKNHPNQYIYFNELIGGTEGAKGNYEMDYYSNTVKQAVYWLVENEKLQHKKVKLVSNNELLTVTNYTTKIADSIQVVWTRDYERYKQDWDYAIFTTRTFSPSQLKNGYFPPKGTIHTIDVEGVPVCAIVKRLNKLTSQGYSFSSKFQYDQALPFYLQAIEADSTDEEAIRMSGLCLLNLGKPDEALYYIDKSIALNPEGFMAYYLKAFYYLGKEDVEKAENFFKISIKNRINNGDAHAELGSIYLEKGLSSMAIDSYLKALEFGNTQARTFTNLGVAYINNQNYETALNYLNAAINKDPSYLPAYKSMAECFERYGDMETAARIRARMAQIQQGG